MTTLMLRIAPSGVMVSLRGPRFLLGTAAKDASRSKQISLANKKKGLPQ
jgi:hypothetical protein